MRWAIWQWSVWEAEGVHSPGLGVLYFQEQWAEPLVEPLLLSLLCRNQRIWGFQVPWKNRRAGVSVETTAKGSNSVCELAAVGWLYSSLIPYQSYLLITYQPILRIFDNFLVSVSFFCTSLWPGTGMLAKGRGVTCSYCHCLRGLSFLTGCSVLLGFQHVCFFQPSSSCLWILWNLYFESYLLFWK